MNYERLTCFYKTNPISEKDQMNANKVLTRDYENETLGEHGKNKPKTNPIKPNFYTKNSAHCL